MRCLGRLVNDTKGTYCLPFEAGGYFHIPIQCDRAADGLCANCLVKKERTDAKVALMTGKSLQGTHPSFLHGLVTEPIPEWSHIYDGAWYRLKISNGSIVSDSNMAKAKAAVAAIGAAPEPVPAAIKKPVQKFKLKAKAAAKTVEEPVKPIATVTGEPVEPETVIRIEVKKLEIGGRLVLLDSSSDKVYDLKCKYLGRHDVENDAIVPFPDSDAE
jgi:hypothetical protein